MTDQTTRPVWIDGDPLMEAVAAAVWEQCGADVCARFTVDDPRNIAAVAAHVARAAVRAETLRDAREICDEAGAVYTSKALNQHADAAYTLMERFQRKADEAESNAAAVLPAPTDQTAAPVASTAPLAAGLPLVKGRCPACGTAGLFLGDGGYVTCSLIDCPEPDAASTLLEPTREARQDPTQDGTAAHTGGNAEDCPVCRPQIDKTVLYPWICTGLTAVARPGQPEAEQQQGRRS